MTLTEEKSRLIHDLCSAEKLVQIATGEADPNIYNDPCVIAAFRGAAKRGVKIDVIAGPAIVIDKPPIINSCVRMLSLLIEEMSSVNDDTLVIISECMITMDPYKSSYFRAASEGIAKRGIKVEFKALKCN